MALRSSIMPVHVVWTPIAALIHALSKRPLSTVSIDPTRVLPVTNGLTKPSRTRHASSILATEQNIAQCSRMKIPLHCNIKILSKSEAQRSHSCRQQGQDRNDRTWHLVSTPDVKLLATIVKYCTDHGEISNSWHASPSEIWCSTSLWCPYWWIVLFILFETKLNSKYLAVWHGALSHSRERLRCKGPANRMVNIYLPCVHGALDSVLLIFYWSRTYSVPWHLGIIDIIDIKLRKAVLWSLLYFWSQVYPMSLKETSNSMH